MWCDSILENNAPYQCVCPYYQIWPHFRYFTSKNCSDALPKGVWYHWWPQIINWHSGTTQLTTILDRCDETSIPWSKVSFCNYWPSKFFCLIIWTTKLGSNQGLEVYNKVIDWCIFVQGFGLYWCLLDYCIFDLYIFFTSAFLW